MERSFFSKVQDLLLRKQKKVEEEIKAVSEDDPVMADGLAEASEPGTDSWRTDAHTQLLAVKTNLLNLSKKITKALFNLKVGKYGKCEKCGKQIERQRLEALPEAPFCITCSSKSSR